MDLNDFGHERTSWLALTGPLQGVEILIVYASPSVSTEFRRRLRSLGIWNDDGVVAGRERQYLVEFCKTYVRDWKGATRGGEAVPYQAEPMATILWEVRSQNDLVHRAIAQEESFFGNGSGGSMPS